jgi:hypothetical protein
LNTDAKLLAMIAGNGAMEVAESDDRPWMFVALQTPSLGGGIEALHMAMSMMPLVVT